MLTRRSLLAFLFAPQGLKRLTREPSDGASEVPRPEGFILRGPLQRASDGSDAFHIGEHYLTLHPSCALLAGVDALEDRRVKLELVRDE